MQVAKPSKEIFERVIADAGIDPQETLFIDDSAENCRVAQTLGISTYTPAEDEDWSHLFK
jgi:putative hydrolase of the HAD superfamily